MPLFGELFVSDMIKKPVLDPQGDELGRVRDFIVIKGKQLPTISALVLKEKKKRYLLKWEDVSIFNKRIISSKIFFSELTPYTSTEDNLLIVRDIFDKQIVDANGAKIVRVNDVRVEGEEGYACINGVDVGVRGIMRRLGIERKSENLYRIFRKSIPYNIIRWSYIEPLEPRLSTLSLAVPRQMLSAMHPADIADIISKAPFEQGVELFNKLDPNVAADALHELEPNVQKAIIDSLDKNYAIEIVERMPPDEAADLLADLESDKTQEILESIEKEEAEDIQELLAHEKDTAGGLMTNQFIAFAKEMTIEDAIEKLRMEASEVEIIYYVFIIDEEGKLTGVTTLRDMILNSPSLPLSEIMETKVKYVTSEADQQLVAETMSKYNLIAIPVVDEDNELLGIVTIDDVVDLLLPASSRKKRRSV